MLSFLFVGHTKLATDILYDVFFAPVLAAPSTWQCLYIAFFRNYLSVVQCLG